MGCVTLAHLDSCKGGLVVEKLYVKLNNIGICSLVVGIVTIGVSIAAGVVMIVNGSRLLKSKKDIIF
jgi:hypothetical protein